MSLRTILAAAMSAVLIACGGGGGDSWVTPAPAQSSSGIAASDNSSAATSAAADAPLVTDSVQTKDDRLKAGAEFGQVLRPLAASPWGSRAPGFAPNSITLSSDSGDYIGGGNRFSYTNANALVSVTAVQGTLSINVTGDQNWRGDFVLPSAKRRLEAGSFNGLTRASFHVPANGGLSWSGEGRGCNVLTGSLTIGSVSYRFGTDVLEAIDLSFEQHCEGGNAALRGQIHWSVQDTSTAPGPVTPPPAGLWAPAAGTTPATGNYIYLASDPGDYIGNGRYYTYSRTNASLSVAANANYLSITVAGDKSWNGNFIGMSGLSRIQPGYYGDLRRYPFHNPVKGGMNWSGDGRGCNTLRAWVVVDAVTYSGDTLQSLDLRFEQHCEGVTAALRGKIHWTADDTTMPPGPVDPPPAGLWTPPVGATPGSGSYVYLASDPGDYIGAGATTLYTPATNPNITVGATGGHLMVGIPGSYLPGWTGDFAAMNTLSRLEPGYYGDLRRYPFHNPVKGGLSWYGQGRGCNTLSGWFVVDAVTYAGSTLQSIDLRFEQHCEGGAPALRGKVHWGY